MKKQINKSIQQAVEITRTAGGEVSYFAIEQMQRKLDNEITHAEYVELIVANAKSEQQEQNYQRVTDTAMHQYAKDKDLKINWDAHLKIDYSSLSGEYDFEDDD